MKNFKFYQKQANFWQFFIPTTILVLTVYLIFKLDYPLNNLYNGWLLYLSRLDTLTLLAYTGANRSIPEWAWLSLLTLIITALTGRFFCGWICPVGALLGIFHRIKSKFSPRNTSSSFLGETKTIVLKFLLRLRYWWLAMVVIFLIGGNGLFFIFTPLALISHEVTGIYFGQIPWLLILIVLLGLIFFPRFWCVYICPSGILFSLMAKISLGRLKPAQNCNNCGLCRKTCPVNATQIPGQTYQTDTSYCLVCGQCWSVCPRHAIKWQKKSLPFSNGNGKTRREFIFTAAVMITGFFGAFTQKPLATNRNPAGVLRPPGAIPEPDFLAACSRCGRCVKVCPSQALVPMPFNFNDLLATFETPRLVPRKGRCELCMLCPKVCPTGAIKDIDLAEVKIGTAVINKKTCLAWAEDKLCLVCAEQCPVSAVIIDKAEKPIIDFEKCIGCGACENSCPVEESAIIVVSL